MWRIVVVVAAVLVVGSGCSGGTQHVADQADGPGQVTASNAGAATTSPTEAPTPTRTPEADGRADLEAAVRAYSAAYLGGDGAAAFDAMSARCQQRIGRDQMIGVANAAKVQYGEQEIATLTVDAMEGTLARVTYTYEDHVLDQTSEPWVKESGQWREDDC